MATPSWRSVLADPAVLSALREAAASCTRDGCAHEHRDTNGQPTDDPAWCTCDENRMMPLELSDWIEREVHVSRARPIRFERGARPFRAKYPNMLKAVAAG